MSAVLSAVTDIPQAPLDENNEPRVEPLKLDTKQVRFQEANAQFGSLTERRVTQQSTFVSACFDVCTYYTQCIKANKPVEVVHENGDQSQRQVEVVIAENGHSERPGVALHTIAFEKLTEAVRRACVLLQRIQQFSGHYYVNEALKRFNQGLVDVRLAASDPSLELPKLTESMLAFRFAASRLEEMFGDKDTVPKRLRLKLAEVTELTFTLVGERLNVLSLNKDIRIAAMRAVKRRELREQVQTNTTTTTQQPLHEKQRKKLMKKQKKLKTVTQAQMAPKRSKMDSLCLSIAECMLYRLGPLSAWEVWHDIISTSTQQNAVHYLLDIHLDRLASRDTYIEYGADMTRIMSRIRYECLDAELEFATAVPSEEDSDFDVRTARVRRTSAEMLWDVNG